MISRERPILRPFRESLNPIPRYNQAYVQPRRRRVNPFREGDVIQVAFPSGIPFRWRICSLGVNTIQVESLPNLKQYPVDRLVLIEMTKDDRIQVIPREIAILVKEEENPST